MADLSLPRELGSDITVTCAVCGSKRELAMSDYGSLSPEPCAECAKAKLTPVDPVKPLSPPAYEPKHVPPLFDH